MSNNLLKTVQENLGYPPLQKIDANISEVIVDDGKQQEDRFNQAVVPAVLTALFKYSCADEGAEKILNAPLSTDWPDFIFSNHKEAVIKKIADYSQHTKEETAGKIKTVAEEAIRVIRAQVTNKGSIKDVKKVLIDSLDDVLLYLPVNMQIGELLHDNTLDDNTHKMEGPVSDLMHAIGRSFSGSDNKENDPSGKDIF